jgi:nucleoside phosphorylase
MVVIHINSTLEWAAINDVVKPSNICSFPYGEYFTEKCLGIDCTFYHSGETKTLAAVACQYAIDHWKAELVIVLGTCGGVSDQIKKFDIILVQRTAQYDIKPIAKLDGFFSEEVEIDNSWLNIEEFRLPLKTGFIATADQSVTSSNHYLLSEHEVLAADWETAAIAKICSINGIRCCVLRGVSDVAFGDESNGEYQLNDYKNNTGTIMSILVKGYLPYILSRRNK